MLLATCLLVCSPHFSTSPVPPQTAAEDLPACVQGFFKSARSRSQEQLPALLDPDCDIVELGTLFELLSEMPFKMKVLDKELRNQNRAVVCVSLKSHLDVEGARFWFWLQAQEGSDLKLFGVHSDRRYSREWLFQTPKLGSAKSPLDAANTLFGAMQNGDERAAESHASDLAWRADGGDLENLFQTARTTGLGFVVERPKQNGERALVSFGLHLDGNQAGAATLYLEKRGPGWIATGFGDDTEHARKFLAGKAAGTVWPKSPFDAYQLFFQALDKEQVIRMQSLSAPSYWGKENGAAHWKALGKLRLKAEAAPNSVIAKAGRASARIDFIGKNGKAERSEYCLWLSTPSGWRVVDATSDVAEAEIFVSGEIVPPQPQ